MTIELPRLMKSPFNGAEWPVHPDVTPEMYEALLAAGFTPIIENAPRKEKGKS